MTILCAKDTLMGKVFSFEKQKKKVLRSSLTIEEKNSVTDALEARKLENQS
jgi:hypothetical protein